MPVKIDLQIATNSTAVLPTLADFEHWAALVLKATSTSSDAELTIRLVDASESQQLNDQYRQKNKPTNVLSFPFSMPIEVMDEEAQSLLGDLVICAPLVAAEAAQQGKSEQAHWAHLTLHGILHLLGFDHIEDDEADAMETLEQSLLAELGYPDPYQSF